MDRQLHTWDVTLVFDSLAFPGCQWWAHAEPASGEWGGYGVATRLCNDAGEALAELASKVSRVVEAAGC